MRWWGWVVGCVCPLWVEAGMVEYAFEWPVDLQPGTRYVLQASVTVGTTLAVVHRPLTLLPLTQCATIVGPTPTAETLCGQTCLEPGDYTLHVYAVVADGRQSPLSNEFDLDLTADERCLPPPVVVPPPPPRRRVPPGPGVDDALAAIAATVVATFPGSAPPPLPALINRDCVHWRITGPCFCNPFTPCVQVEYWEPGWIVETVKKPGDSVVPVLGDLLAPVLSALGLPLHGGGSGVSAAQAGATSLQFNEAHVYTFPQLFGGPCTSCAPSGGLPVLNYASEVDPGWRTEPPPLFVLHPLQQIGLWAPLFPRTGKAITGSEPVGSGVCAVRALDIAHHPLGHPPNVDTHLVTAPTGASSRCLQLASPIQTPCLPAGTPPNLWETGALSVGGKYTWIFWTKRSCCVPANQSTCGITLPGLGSYGANGCEATPNP